MFDDVGMFYIVQGVLVWDVGLCLYVRCICNNCLGDEGTRPSAISI